MSSLKPSKSSVYVCLTRVQVLTFVPQKPSSFTLPSVAGHSLGSQVQTQLQKRQVQFKTVVSPGAWPSCINWRSAAPPASSSRCVCHVWYGSLLRDGDVSKRDHVDEKYPQRPRNQPEVHVFLRKFASGYPGRGRKVRSVSHWRSRQLVRENEVCPSEPPGH
jgi:hypothetical protein